MLTELAQQIPLPAAVFSATSGALETANPRWRAISELTTLSTLSTLSASATQEATLTRRSEFFAALARAAAGEQPSFALPVTVNGRLQQAPISFFVAPENTGTLRRNDSVLVWLTPANHLPEDLSEAMERSLLRHRQPITHPWAYLGADGVYSYASPEALAMSGLRGDTMVGSHFVHWLGDQPGGRLAAEYIQRGLAGENLVYERLRCDDRIGENRWHRLTLTPDRDPSGTLLGLFIVSIDVHERRGAEEKARLAENQLDFERRSGAFLVVDLDESMRVVGWSPQAEALFGFTEQEALGQTPREMGTVVDIDTAEQRIKELFAEPRLHTKSVRTENRDKSGKTLFLDWYRSVQRDPQSGKLVMHSIGIDVTAEERLARTIELSTKIDPLTGLANREALVKRVKQNLAQEKPFALLHIDLDHFKKINDYRGYAVGDQVLCTVAQRLVHLTPETDCIGRLGGDSFVAILHLDADATPDSVISLSQALLSCVIPLQQFDTFSYTVTASAGLAFAPSGCADSVDVLFHHAELAMNKAKAASGNCIVIYDESVAKALRQAHEQEDALRVAVRTEALSVYFQPLLSLETNRIVGGEALARWKTPDGTYIEPETFVPLAEKLGLIHELWAFVMRRACALAVAINTGQSQTCPISINVSPVQLRFPNFDDLVIQALKTSNCSPQWIAIEVTESAALSDDTAYATLHNLSYLGIKCGVDDFGTGYSNFSHLKNLPLDTIKIDKVFVRQLATRDYAIVRGMIELGHALNLKVVAEGVEFVEELDALKTLGCDLYQGFIASKAVAAYDFAAMLNADREHGALEAQQITRVSA